MASDRKLEASREGSKRRNYMTSEEFTIHDVQHVSNENCQAVIAVLAQGCTGLGKWFYLNAKSGVRT